ncbi:MAG: aminoglycoside phosphotransferase family protein [Pikeienuella sp.]
MTNESLLKIERTQVKAKFLAAAGWGGAQVAVLAGDASNRRYDRVSGTSGPAVLMDSPKERGEDITIFLAFTQLLRDLGYSAPEIYEVDVNTGFALIEDLGDDLYAKIAAQNLAQEHEIYAAAVDLLADLHKTTPPAKAGQNPITAPVNPYDMSVLTREAMLLLEWWYLGATGKPASPDLCMEYKALITGTCERVAADRSALVLRDYHAENLLWLPSRSSHKRVGLLDYQDALAGSPAYDLASLLEDARRDTSIELQAAMIDRYIRVAGVSRDQFTTDYTMLAAQRNLKIVGIFARLCIRDGKAHYLDLIPRVWAHLMHDLSHPRLSELSAFISKWVPAPTPDLLTRVGAQATK